ncbi:MAG: lipid-A-disaccharide synthase [Planctomycetaceae bacterium]
MKLYFSVGEPSGDLHGANLIAALRERDPYLAVLGLGGPRMAAAGANLQKDMSDLAVMGLWPVLKLLPKFFRLLSEVEAKLKSEKPDAVVLIDYPGFNWHVAKRAKRLGIPVVYYGLPQIWAWAQWRVAKVRKYVDHALCKLPFEPAWFRSQGCEATYVGHPYFDELRNRQLDRTFQDSLQWNERRLVTILPGSRRQEVKNNLPDLLRSARLVHAAVPDLQFAIASYNPVQAKMAAEILAKEQARGPMPEVIIHQGRTPELIDAASVCLACSGSVSLELLYHACPSVMVYRVPWMMEQVLRQMVKVKYMTLVNLLTTKELHPRDLRSYDPKLPGNEAVLFPEYPTSRDESAKIAAHAIGWLTDEASRQELIGKLAALRDTLTCHQASQTAADYICREIGRGAKASAVRLAS